MEAGYAVALHVAGAGVGECIAQYQVAIALNPNMGPLRLNLAQLLFIKGDDTEANTQLTKAFSLGLDPSARLEAEFYLLSHTSSDPAAIFGTTKSLLTQGARLRWNVRPNIEAISRRDPKKAALLELVVKVMVRETASALLDEVLVRWRYE